MTIREATPADYDPLTAVWLRSVRATHSFLTEEKIQELLPLVRASALPSLELWVLDSEVGPVGFIGFDGSKMEALFLDPAIFRRGWGRRLVEHARRLKGPLTVDVNEQNSDAVRFYEALGFRVVGRSDTDQDGRPYPLLHMAESQGAV